MSEMDELQVGAGTPTVAQATEAEVVAAITENRTPVCGFCKADPLTIHIDDNRQDLGESWLLTRTICCQQCRAAITVSVLGVVKKAKPNVALSTTDQEEWIKTQKAKFGLS